MWPQNPRVAARVSRETRSVLQNIPLGSLTSWAARCAESLPLSKPPPLERTGLYYSHPYKWAASPVRGKYFSEEGIFLEKWERLTNPPWGPQPASGLFFLTIPDPSFF